MGQQIFSRATIPHQEHQNKISQLSKQSSPQQLLKQSSSSQQLFKPNSQTISKYPSYYSNAITIQCDKKYIKFSIPKVQTNKTFLQKPKTSMSRKIPTDKTQVAYHQQNQNQWLKFLQTQMFNNLLSLNLRNYNNSTLPSIKAPKLQDILLYQSKINNLSQFSKEFYPQLKNIQISHQYFIKFNKFNAPKLQKIYIYNSQFQDISEFFEQYYPQLYSVVLLESELTMLPNINAPKLIRLQIKNYNRWCYLKQLNLISYSLLENLQMRSIINANDIINQLNSSTFSSILQISLAYCNLKTLSKFNTPQLEKINCSNNKLQSVDEFFKGDYPNLSTIKFELNQIASIPSINNVPKLKQIIFYDNMIKSISQFEKGKYETLQWINFNNNKIQKIHKINAPDLTHFDISDNQLTQIDSQFFIKKYKLQSINLSQNKIAGNLAKTLNGQQDIFDKKIKDNQKSKLIAWKYFNVLKINQNILQFKSYSYSVSFKLQRLNLSSNNINNIQFLIYLDLILLLDLDLTRNHITSYKSFYKLNISSIQHLKLCDNRNQDFSSLSRTKIFSFSSKNQQNQKSQAKTINLHIYNWFFIKKLLEYFNFLFKLERNLKNIKNQKLALNFSLKDFKYIADRYGNVFKEKWRNI